MRKAALTSASGQRPPGSGTSTSLRRGSSSAGLGGGRGLAATSTTRRAQVGGVAACDDGEDGDEGERLPESDVETVQRLLESAVGPERDRLAALLGRLQSDQEPVRQSALRELHALRALGGATSHLSLQEAGRTLSERRMRPSGTVNGAHDNNSGSAASKEGHNLGGVLNVSSDLSGALGTPQTAAKRLSFWQRKRLSSQPVSVKAAVGGGGEDAGSTPGSPTLLKAPAWDESWDVPCDQLSQADWLDPHVATDGHPLLFVKTKKFAVSLGGPMSALPDSLLLEDWEAYRFLYEEVFVGRSHSLYLGRGAKGPVIVAVESPTANERKGDRNRYRVLLLDKTGYHKASIPSSQNSRERTKLCKRVLPGPLEGVVLRKPEKQQQLSTQLLIFEKKRVVHHAKFGLLYRKAGQLEENDVYSNEHGSPQFVDFLSTVADIIPLKGHTGFRAGLDVKEDLTGSSSAYTRMSFDRRGAPVAPGQPDAKLTLEMMLHVGPLLPYDPVNPQQLHRKRHVGNDVVVVVFCEGNDPFNPEALTSNYNHVFLLVRPVPDDPTGRKRPTHFAVSHASVRGVKPFRPCVPADGLVPAADIRAWLLTKVLNAERAAMYAPEFSQKLSRTITTVVGSWVEEF